MTLKIIQCAQMTNSKHKFLIKIIIYLLNFFFK